MPPSIGHEARVPAGATLNWSSLAFLLTPFLSSVSGSQRIALTLAQTLGRTGETCLRPRYTAGPPVEHCLASFLHRNLAHLLAGPHPLQEGDAEALQFWPFVSTGATTEACSSRTHPRCAPGTRWCAPGMPSCSQVCPTVWKRGIPRPCSSGPLPAQGPPQRPILPGLTQGVLQVRPGTRWCAPGMPRYALVCPRYTQVHPRCTPSTPRYTLVCPRYALSCPWCGSGIARYTPAIRSPFHRPNHAVAILSLVRLNPSTVSIGVGLEGNPGGSN